MPFYPYLNFGRDCREAFTRYQEVFGGELVLMPWSDMPSEDGVAEELKDLIMHAALTFTDGGLLMGSDDTDKDGPVRGMYVNYSTADVADAERAFAGLADGGDVTMPMSETFFAARFGMCVDRFGTPWMIVAEAPQPAS